MMEKREIGIVGLGKMGRGIALRLREKGWRVVGFDRADTEDLVRQGIVSTASLRELVRDLEAPRTVWLMVPAGQAVEETLFSEEGLAKLLGRGDTVIDGGNSFYRDSVARGKKLEKLGIRFLDAGFSGGPEGARRGGCIMVGGDEKTFKEHEPLFEDLSVERGYQFFSGIGAGHFVKMVHNGIEYGMMQAIAEGFAVLKKSKYALDLSRVADIYAHGSVIESRLLGFLKQAYEAYGEDLKDVSSTVGHTGEGKWTAETARSLRVPVPIIEASYRFRVESEKKPSYAGKILSALRSQFGGHSVKK